MCQSESWTIGQLANVDITDHTSRYVLSRFSSQVAATHGMPWALHPRATCHARARPFSHSLTGHVHGCLTRLNEYAAQRARGETSTRRNEHAAERARAGVEPTA